MLAYAHKDHLMPLMMGQMAIVMALPGFYDLGRSVTPIFLLMNHFFLPILNVSRKNEKNIY